MNNRIELRTKKVLKHKGNNKDNPEATSIISGDHL